ncbi:hypothetical protein VTJ04DRAFT_7998 [Mycothermus thermophilus]|uniref:uncharacterized protein n=1 Tax=Humicola insolens TaxID=85995 RepID=UPI0037446600
MSGSDPTTRRLRSLPSDDRPVTTVGPSTSSPDSQGGSQTQFQQSPFVDHHTEYWASTGQTRAAWRSGARYRVQDLFPLSEMQGRPIARAQKVDRFQTGNFAPAVNSSQKLGGEARYPFKASRDLILELDARSLGVLFISSCVSPHDDLTPDWDRQSSALVQSS